MKKIFKINKKPSNYKELKKANDWFMHIESGSMTAETHKQFQNWLSENPVHKSKFDLVDSIWDDLDTLENNLQVQEIISKSNTRQIIGNKEKWSDKLGLRIPVMRHIAIAASVLLIVGGLWLTQINQTSERTYQTLTGELSTMLLEDGSTVDLDTKTVINVTFSEDLRLFELKKGRALFSVAHDPDRPFVVSAGKVVIRALGTIFNVSKVKKGRVIVSVTEGSVQINSIKKNSLKDIIKAPEPLKLEPKKIKFKVAKQNLSQKKIIVSGTELVIDEENKTFEMKSVDINQVNAWQDGRLIFQSTALIDVIEELNRYTENKIIIGDKHLEDITISLNFKIKDRKEFVSTLGLVVSIRSKKLSNGQIVIFGS